MSNKHNPSGKAFFVTYKNGGQHGCLTENRLA